MTVTDMVVFEGGTLVGDKLTGWSSSQAAAASQTSAAASTIRERMIV
jgi:hypothetical protein